MALLQKKVDTKWSPHLAYVIGIIASDGNVSPDLRHINITSKDEQLLYVIKTVLHLSNSIGKKGRGDKTNNKPYFVLQFGDRNFVDFLQKIGITPNKSKTIQSVHVPTTLFGDFLRGVIDGDGCINSFMHPQSKLPQIRVRIASASLEFLKWLMQEIRNTFDTSGGYLCKQKTSSTYILSYAKADSVKILKNVYYTDAICLLRKKKIALDISGEW